MLLINVVINLVVMDEIWPVKMNKFVIVYFVF